MMASLIKIAMTLIMLVVLSGCESTIKSLPKPNMFNHLDSTNVEAIEEVNQQITRFLLTGDATSLKQMVSVQLAPEKLDMGVHEYNLGAFVAPKNVIQLNNQVVSDLIGVSDIGQLNYLYSESHNDNVWASHYQVVGDMLLDFTIYVDKQSLRVIDWRQFPFRASFMLMMVEVDDLVYDFYDQGKYYEVMTYSNFIEMLSMYAMGKKTHVELMEAFEILPDELKQNWLVAEFMSKTAGAVERDYTARQQVDELLSKYHPKALYLNWYYMQTGNYGQVIDNILDAKARWIRGSVLQQELVRVLLLAERYDQAIGQAQDLLSQLPDAKMSHLILLRTSLEAERHQLTTETLMAIKDKFNFNVTARWLRGMTKGGSYVASDEFSRFNELAN